MNNDLRYIGNELELFQYATNWKRYFSSFFSKHVKGHVLEVGAGIGTTTSFLINPNVTNYTCVEPDARLADEILKKIAERKLPSFCSVHKGVLSDLNIPPVDSILYIDVIEHIYDDKAELTHAAELLKSGGFLCILVPANPSDFSPFDHTIGHFRRYDKAMLLKSIPEKLGVKWCKHLDFIGAMSSKINKFVLKQNYPSKRQILFWDRVMIPISKFVDPVIGYSAGKSLLLVAQKR